MTVGIFATAAIATAFLEGQVLPINLLSLIGLVCFLGIAAMSILVLTNRVRVPLGSDDAGPPSDDEAAREALTHIRTAVDRATLYLQISILLLAAEIIVVILFFALPVAAVFVVFVWGARKDGEADRAVQRRLGIRRRTRLGR